MPPILLPPPSVRGRLLTVEPPAPGRNAPHYTLNELEARLAGTFVRASRGVLVNVDRIDRIASNGDGSATLTLAGGATVHVTRRRAADVRRALEP